MLKKSTTGRTPDTTDRRIALWKQALGRSKTDEGREWTGRYSLMVKNSTMEGPVDEAGTEITSATRRLPREKREVFTTEEEEMGMGQFHC